MIKMIKRFYCSNTFTFILFILYQLALVSSFQNSMPIGHNVISSFSNVSPKRRSFFETVKNSYQIIPNKLKQISIMNMLSSKRKNRKPNEDEQMFYSDLINNPAMFTNLYSEKFAPQFQSIFSELDESYAKNPPPNIGTQLALKPNGGLSFQPIVDLDNIHNPPNGQPHQTASVANSHSSGQMMTVGIKTEQPPTPGAQGGLQNGLQNMIQGNANKLTSTLNKDNSAMSSNIINSLFGGHQPNKNSPFNLMMMSNGGNSQQSTHNKLSDTSLTASASGSPFSKQHFSSFGSLSSLTSNLLNLKNKFNNQKNQHFKSYKNYKDTMLNSGSMLASANQYNYFQQKPAQSFQQQSSFNRYQMISSPPGKRNCGRQCSNRKQRIVAQQQLNNNNYGNFNQQQFSKGQDYESNLINSNVRQKQFYSMMQERQRPSGGYGSSGGEKTNFNAQKQNNFFKPIADERGSQIKVGSDIITIDDIEQALRHNNLHQITNKDAQVYTQLHNLLMNSINVNGEVNVVDNGSPQMITKGKIIDDEYNAQQQPTVESMKGWRPKITQQVQQEEIKQIKDTDLNVFDEPQIKETDQQLKISDEDDEFIQQKEPVQQQLITPSTTTQWQPVKRPSSGTKTPNKSIKSTKSKTKGLKTPPIKFPSIKGTKSTQKIAKLQLSNDDKRLTLENSTDSADNPTGGTFDNTSTTASSVEDSKREVEDSRLANSTTLFTSQGGGMKIVKKIKRRKKKSRSNSELNDVNLLTTVRSGTTSKSGESAKLVANGFADQVRTDVSSESESTTFASTSQIDDQTTNANTEVQFDDTTATSDEELNQRNKVTSTTINSSNRQEQVKDRMLAKKRKVMESITTTESSDTSIDTTPDTSRDMEASLDVDKDTENNLQDTYFNENITDDSVDSVRSGRLRLKSAVRRKKNQQLKANNLPAHTSINSAFGDFTATFSADESDDDTFDTSRRKKKNKQIEPDESLENMHFRIDDVDADEYDALHSDPVNSESDKENDGFSNGFSNENTETSETRNQLNKLPASGQANQTAFDSLLKTNRTNLTNVQPIEHLMLMSMHGHSGDADDESFDNMDVNQTIADLVQKIHQANGGDLNAINQYRNYFTEDEFDLLTDLLKREAIKNTTISSFNSTTNSSGRDQVSTSESQKLNHKIFYTHFSEKDAIQKFNNSPIYLNDNGQASLKEYYFNKANSKLGLDVLLNIQEKRPPVPGLPLVDYPLISNVAKKTSFNCSNRLPGLYADYESGCIRYFQCSSNVMSSPQTFYCANGTLFDQINKVCSWWYNVDCKPQWNINQSNNTNLHPVYVPNSKTD